MTTEKQELEKLPFDSISGAWVNFRQHGLPIYCYDEEFLRAIFYTGALALMVLQADRSVAIPNEDDYCDWMEQTRKSILNVLELPIRK